jgi:hypothetical protein
MTKTVRRVAEVAPVANSQDESQENSQAIETTMQVLKPEPQPEPEPEKPNVYDVIRKIYEQYHRSEQHSNYLQQLDRLQQFRSQINNNTNLVLSNGAGQATFTSVDPAAVDTLIDICIKNVKGKISEIENMLIAA